MYKSKKSIDHDSARPLAELKRMVYKKQKLYCSCLKRHISLEKLPECVTKRKDSKRRIRVINVAFDILRHAKEYEEKIVKGQTCFQIKGTDCHGTLVIVHVREEQTKKDRVLYFISCF